MERARRTGTKKQSREAVRAALRAAREGGAARSDQREAKEEKDVYEQVTEQEYADLVRKRRQNEDFVVDDDGLGYFDDGEEHFGEDEAEGADEDAGSLGCAEGANRAEGEQRYRSKAGAGSA